MTYQLAVVQQNYAKDTSQIKFSPSQETLSPFVFIILTSLFKEVSSPTSPAWLLCLSHPSHHHHLFGAYPGWGAAMCFSHSSLPQKMCRRVGGDEERHLLTKINRHLLSFPYIYLQWVRSSSVLGPFYTWLHHKISLTLRTYIGKVGKDDSFACFISFSHHILYLLFRKCLHPAGGHIIIQGNREYVNHHTMNIQHSTHYSIYLLPYLYCNHCWIYIFFLRAYIAWEKRVENISTWIRKWNKAAACCTFPDM